MLSKIEKFRDEHPKVRRVFDEIGDFCNRISIALCCLSAILICIPTIIVFFCLPESVRIWISSIIGGVLSLIIIPLLINYIKHKQKKIDELYEINKSLYLDLSAIFVQLLEEEYIFHDKNEKEKIVTANDKEKVEEILNPLKCFICENYVRMCNTFFC